MKIESCPKCGKIGEVFFSREWKSFVAHCRHELAYAFLAKTKLWAIVQWNRYCRRERRRMKKEEGK